jgi:integrase
LNGIMKHTQILAAESDALDLTGPAKPVSSRSEWGHPVWRLDPLRPGANIGGDTIYWPEDLGASLLELFKRLLWSLYVSHADGGPLDTGTIARYGTAVGLVGRWMNEWEYSTFAELTPEAVGYLRNNLKARVASLLSEEFDDVVDEETLDNDLDDALDEDDEVQKPPLQYVSFSTVYSAMRIIGATYLQREALKRLHVAAPSEDPLDNRSPYQWALDVRAPSPVTSGPFCDEVSLPLMAAVHRLLDENGPADQVIALQARCVAIRSPTKGGRLRSRTMLERHEFGTLAGEERPWHPPLPLMDAEGKLEPASFTLRKLVIAMRDAAILCLLQNVGMRLGEILSIQSGPDTETGLPACVARERSAGNELDLFYVSATIKKGRDTPDATRWLVGAVPAGSNFLPPTVRAIQVLERLLKPWRDISTDPVAGRALIVSLTSPGLPDQGSSVVRITTHRAATSIAQLYPSLLDFASLPDTSLNGIDLTSMKRTCGRHIRWAQWRKTFAVNIFRINSKALPALKRHFHHQSMATLEGAYIGADPGLLEMADDARMTATVRFLKEFSQGGSGQGGRGGRILERQADRIAAMDEVGDGLEGEVRRHGVRIFPAAYGDCAIFIAPQSAACHRQAGNSSFLHDRPDYAERSPDLCAGCRNVVIGREHTPFWRARFSEFNSAKRSYRHEPGAAALFRSKAENALKMVRAIKKRSR